MDSLFDPVRYAVFTQARLHILPQAKKVLVASLTPLARPPGYNFFCLFVSFVCLFLISEREGASMCWFPPQMAAVARSEPGNRIQLWSPGRVAEAQAIPTASLRLHVAPEPGLTPSCSGGNHQAHVPLKEPQTPLHPHLFLVSTLAGQSGQCVF